MTPLKFAQQNNFAEIAEMRDKHLRKMILDFAKEYHENESKKVAENAYNEGFDVGANESASEVLINV